MLLIETEDHPNVNELKHDELINATFTTTIILQ